jgi:hypothetical protein
MSTPSATAAARARLARVWVSQPEIGEIWYQP